MGWSGEYRMERWDRVGWRGGVGCRLERLDRVYSIGRVVVQGVYRSSKGG